MAQKKHSGWERKRVRLIQDKLIKRAERKAVEKPAPKAEGEMAQKTETPPQ